MTTRGYIHSVDSFGSADGPGIRFLIFLRGCAMRCRYCHNVDTWTMRAGDEKKGVVTADGDRVFPRIREEKDDLRTPAELLDQAERYRSYWGDRGGITVSGGEPLLQIDFVTELFQQAQERGINTCLDTSGQPFRPDGAVREKVDRLMEVTDLVLLDIKEIDPAKHRWLTGQPNDNILAFARYLDEIHQPVWIRYVLLPGVTDDEEDLFRTRDFLSGLSNIERIDVLPYHTMGVYKWKEVGIPYSLGRTDPPDAGQVDRARRILQEALPSPRTVKGQ